MMFCTMVSAAVGVVCLLAAIQEWFKRDIVRAVVFIVLGLICSLIFFGTLNQ